MSTNIIQTPTARPCRQNPQQWDADRGGLVEWIRALRGCAECPFQKACEQDRDELFASHRPAGIIIAGTFYTEDGRALETPDELLGYADSRLRRQRRENTRRTAA